MLQLVVPRFPSDFPPNNAAPFHLFIEDRRWTRILGLFTGGVRNAVGHVLKSCFRRPGLYGRPSYSFFIP